MRSAAWGWLSVALLVAPLCEASGYGFKVERLLPDGQLAQDLVAGEAMTVRVSGTWPNGCVPTQARWESNQSRKAVLVLSYAQPLSIDTLCTQALVSVRYEVPVQFTAEDIGAVEVQVVVLLGPVAEAQQFAANVSVLDTLELAVQAPAQQRANVWPTALRPPEGFYAVTAQRNLTGHWYAPATSGSGLLLNHQRPGPGREGDALSGLWANFASSGKPQWHWLADGYWATPTRYLGWVYHAEVEPFGCLAVFPNPGCTFSAQPADTILRVGIFELQVQDDGELVLTLDDSGTPLLLGMPQPPVQGYQVRLQGM